MIMLFLSGSIDEQSRFFHTQDAAKHPVHPPSFLSLPAPSLPPRWMDGSFLDLNSESIETEVDEFWREIYKITKVFQNQLKKQRAEESSKLPPGKRLVPIEELAFEELPPKLRVCNVIQDAIKNFKVSSLNLLFLGATTHLCKRSCPSVRRSVLRSVRPPVLFYE